VDVREPEHANVGIFGSEWQHVIVIGFDRVAIGKMAGKLEILETPRGETMAVTLAKSLVARLQK